MAKKLSYCTPRQVLPKQKGQLTEGRAANVDGASGTLTLSEQSHLPRASASLGGA